jgi:hypothetical protein
MNAREVETDYKMNHVLNLMYRVTFVERIKKRYLKHNVIVDKMMQLITKREG